MGNCCKTNNSSSIFNDIYMKNFVNWDKVDDSVEMLSFKGIKTMCKVVSVYDGDTIKVVFPIIGSGSKKLYKWNCRINGVDTPELRTNNQMEKKLGYFVRDKLREKILGKTVYIQCDTFDKYGRLLVNIVIHKEDISKWLLDNKYAFEYDGGKKKCWSEFLKKKKKNYIYDLGVEDCFKDIQHEIIV